MKVVKFLGSVLYGAVIYYLLWLLFYWLIPIVVSLSWGWFVALVFLGGGILAMFVGAVAGLLSAPIGLLSIRCKEAKYPPLLFGAFFLYKAIKLPWMLDMEYDSLRSFWAVTLTIVILILFITLMIAPFKSTTNK